jgi:transcriptional regulator with XRE-family HTH domain
MNYFYDSTFRGCQIFGQRLKSLRESKGLTQKGLADLAGLSQKGVSQWENGERIPGWDAVLKLCQALGVDCNAFGKLDDTPNEKPAPKAGRGRPKKKADGEK